MDFFEYKKIESVWVYCFSTNRPDTVVNLLAFITQKVYPQIMIHLIKKVLSKLHLSCTLYAKQKNCFGQLYTIHPAGELVSEKKVNVFAYINKDEKRVSSFSTFYCFYVTGMKEELLEKYLYQKIR